MRIRNGPLIAGILGVALVGFAAQTALARGSALISPQITQTASTTGNTVVVPVTVTIVEDTAVTDTIAQAQEVLGSVETDIVRLAEPIATSAHSALIFENNTDKNDQFQNSGMGFGGLLHAGAPTLADDYDGFTNLAIADNMGRTDGLIAPRDASIEREQSSVRADLDDAYTMVSDQILEPRRTHYERR